MITLICRLAILILIALVSADTAPAQVIQLKACGTVTNITDIDAQFDLDGSVTNGTPFEVDYTYDLGASDEEAASDVGLYRVQGGTTTLGGYQVRVSPARLATVSIYNDSFAGDDFCSIRNSGAYLEGAARVGASGVLTNAHDAGFIGDFGLSFRDSTRNAVSSDALIVPRLADWPSKAFVMFVSRVGGQIVVQGSISQLAVVPRVSIETAVQVCWGAESNTTYQVQYRSVLTTNMWTNLNGPIPGTGASNCVTDIITAPRRFYRVVVLP